MNRVSKQEFKKLMDGLKMAQLWVVGVLLIGVMGFGCATPNASQTQPSDRPSVPVMETVEDPIIAAVQDTVTRQSLPLSAQVRVGNQVIQLEVAKTVEQQAIGLMNRKELAGDRGMVFLFSPARPVSFWMKNTLIALDMVFVHKGRVVAVSKNVPPCKADPCPTYGPGQSLVDQVIELRAGRAAELGIKAGDPLVVKPL
jgi:hypothetical protein